MTDIDHSKNLPVFDRTIRRRYIGAGSMSSFAVGSAIGQTQALRCRCTVEWMDNSGGIAINFARVKQYLNAIADASGAIATSPHRRFWSVTYQAFVGGQVPNVAAGGQPVPIIDKSDPLQSPFFLILQGGWGGLPQMPTGGPYITDHNFEVDLPDGSAASGQEILAGLAAWLQNGYPEHSLAP